MLDFKDNLWLLAAGFTAVAYVVLTLKKITAKHIAKLVVMTVLISVFIVPAAAEHWEWSVTISSGVTGTLVVFGTNIINALNRKIPEKIAEKIDNL